MKQIQALLAALLSILLLTSCATPYKSAGALGGYDETWLTDREAQIKFAGNGFTSRTRAAEYTAFRACELALDNGFTHFIVLTDEAGGSVSTSQITPHQTTITPDGYGGATARTTPGQTISAFHPRQEMHVIFLYEDELDIAYENGFSPISAHFYLEKNASDRIKRKILEKDD